MVPLIVGTVASDATYEFEDISSRVSLLGDLADIDGSGDIDALTDGLLILRYLFGLKILWLMELFHQSRLESLLK